MESSSYTRFQQEVPSRTQYVPYRSASGCFKWRRLILVSCAIFLGAVAFALFVVWAQPYKLQNASTHPAMPILALPLASKDSYEAILKYIDDFWPKLMRRNPVESGTLIGLPRPYIVPSDGAMFQEFYYWDSYFIALGLVNTTHESLIFDFVENMAFLFRRFEIIPNGNRYYFLTRSQPPFFAALIRLAYEIKQSRHDADATDYYCKLMAVAMEEHETVWLGVAQPNYRLVYHGLSRYFDANFLDLLASAESGWDHSTRFNNSEHCLDYLPVDLNSILYANELEFAAATKLCGTNTSSVINWHTRAAARASTMQSLLWDDAAGFFFDYDYVNERRNLHPSLAGFYVLWAGLASQVQAARMVADWFPRFLQSGGLVTALEQRSDRQWAWPNGWAPLQWLVVQGLTRYGYTAEAQLVMRRWCDNCISVFNATGALWEKYNVVVPGGSEEKGLYGSVKGFGWTNSVFVVFSRQLWQNFEQK